MGFIASPIVEKPVETTGHDSYVRLILRRFLRRRLAIAGLAIVLLLVAFAFIGPHFYKWRYNQIDFEAFLERPSTTHWFGTTQNGFDMLALTMRGMQKSLIITARVIRSMTLSIREREFVYAARFMGVPDWKIIFRHILPNMSSFLIIDATINVSSLILAEVGLSFFGFGVQPPDYITPGQYDMTVFSWLGTPFPISASESIYRKPVGGKVQQNFARIGSDELDHVLDEAAQELDPQKAISLANQADTLIWQEVHSVTTYQRPDIWAVKRGLANIGAYGFSSIAYEDIGWAEPPTGKQ